MMNHPVLSILSLTLLSSSAWAVDNGTPVDWEAQDNTVRLENTSNDNKYCTATLVAGRYALTAAHCLDGYDAIVTASDDHVAFTQFLMHPNYVEDDGFSGEDVGIITLDAPIDYRNIQFFNIENRVVGEPITIAGFGGTVDTLNSVDLTFSHYHDPLDPFQVYADLVSQDSHTIGGDSGAAWVNQNNDIMAIHKGSKSFVDKDRETYGTDIQAVQDFIIENINGWHYPTLAEVDGRTTITVQSLHQSVGIDSAYTEGNITLMPEDSTCVTQGPTAPFETCTYVLEGSSAEEGHLYLSDSEVIHLNKPQPAPEKDEESGGSLGWGSLLLVSLLVWRRKMTVSKQ